MRGRQTGFTLVEIAIVLVIIGLLLGGVLKGQELINSAKVKSMANDFRSLSVLVYGYQDKYRALAGDQDATQLNSSFGAGTATACSGTTGCAPRNGRIDGDWFSGDTATNPPETVVFWQHVRLANLANGPTALTDATFLPTNSDGGRLGVESAPIDAGGNLQPYIVGMRGPFFVCSDAIFGRFVRQIDQILDDGDPATGSVRAVSYTGGARPARGATAVAASALIDNQQYVVCASF